YRARRRERDAVRRTLDKGVESIFRVEGRAEDIGGRRPAAALLDRGPARPRRVAALGPALAAAGLGLALEHRMPRRRTHEDLDPQHARLVGLPEFEDESEIMAVDPRAQEGGRNRK